MENKDLIKIRIRSFAVEALSLVGMTLFGVLASEEFKTLITAHAGTGIFGTVAVLLVTGLVKHLRNKYVLSGLGADQARPLLF